MEVRMKYLVLASAAAFSVCALMAAPAAAQPTQACLAKNLVEGWKVVNDQTLIVNDKAGRQFTVSLKAGCHDLKWPDHLGWTASSGFAIGCVQHNDFLYVPANGGFPGQRCLIDNVTPFSSSQTSAK